MSASERDRRAPAHPPAAESLATMSDHLGRLLAHADRLLQEWETHADGIRARFEAEARAAGDVLHKTLANALAEVATPGRVAGELERAQRAALDLDKRGGARGAAGDKSFADLAREIGSLREEIARRARASSEKPDRARLTLVLALSANALLVAVIAIVLSRSPGVVIRETPAPVVVPPLVAVDAGVAVAPPAQPPPDPCASIDLQGEGAAKRLEQCLAELCAVPETRAALPKDCVWKPADKKTKRNVLSCKLGAAELDVEWTGPCPR